MDLAEIFETLVVQPSPSRREGRVAGWIEDFCRSLGCTVEEDGAGERFGGETGNRLVRLPATSPEAPSLLFSAHMDTVENGDTPIRFRRGGDAYRSAGDTILGADNKTGVACLLAFLQTLKAAPAAPGRGEIRFLFTVGEEIELQGARHLPDDWLDGVAAAFALDHSEPAEIVRAQPAKEALRITVAGAPGHAARPEGRLNAAHILARALAKLPSGRLDRDSTCNLGIVRGGHAINVIPATASAEYELRSLDESRLETYLKQTLETLREEVGSHATTLSHSGETRRARIEIEHNRCYHAYRHAEDALPLRLAREAVRAAGMDPVPVEGCGGSDANVFNARGLPAVVLGCGEHGAHSHNETADLAEMHRCLRVLGALAASRI